MSSFKIASNIGALEAYNALAKLNSQTQKAQLRLATQKRINSVADDTSGFNIGKSLESKVALMQAAQKNVGSAKDMLATAESQLVSIRDMITQIRAKVADSGNAAADLSALASDVRAIADEINSAITNTKFNNTELLTSTSSAAGAGGGMKFQTGVATNDQLTVTFAENVAINAEILSDAIGNSDDGDLIATRDNFESLETSLNNFESSVSGALGKIGNFLQRLDTKDEFLTSAVSNSQASVSRLFDADVALEQLNATKSSIGAQAATAMLAQLNMSPQQVLQLFG
ncbi:MAG: flagellar biosynthesis protein FliC [Ignavibacteriales bacterium]|jgi:flagellin|nr:MAG: flagellar biosynthesis protein FliC [Ignavibacteriales bacterium]